MKFRKIGAIDIGSNAMRLLITQVRESEGETFFKKVSLTRLPVRLGQEAFIEQELSNQTISKFLLSIDNFYDTFAIS